MRRVLMIIALGACSQPVVPEATDVPHPSIAQPAPSFSDGTRTLLSDDEALGLARQCSRGSPGPVDSAWTPSEAQIDALEEQLMWLLQRQLEMAGDHAQPQDYYRQYAGYVIGGRRVIYVNGVHETPVQGMPRWAPDGDWMRNAIIICDGGTISFGAEYDVATGSLSHFAFNGSE